ncbi:ATP-grasp domain-containing protein [Desulfofustis limnaeus]|uniref:ATP-grasp protein n=1 Tax=Desulfofustis limnaeus TaxID=2740163 RepID=A0ABN6M420_9BACT|nr:ATP-grasp domain-containing protein [Desulfofustis limnaeus]BDD87626.1 ATP-grasp protein [Desulfofustis limnaeus]
MRILVTDGDNRAALAITRSLGRRGHHLTVGATGHPSLASSSKYCRERLIYPSPRDHADRFIEELLRAVRDRGIDVVLPVSDVTTIPVCEHKSDFETYCRVPFADETAVKLAADKAYLLSLARDLGVGVPATVIVEAKGTSFELPEGLGFPLVVKPGRSRIRHQDGWLETAVGYVRNGDELARTLDGLPAAAYPVLLQERITGPGSGLFACYDHGRPVAFFSHRRIREKPPSGGVSVLRESIAVSPVAEEYARKLLGHLNWHGVAMVEFKLDERDRLPKLMEINGRFWGSLQLAVDAGVDFPAIVADLAAGKAIEPVRSYRTGVKTRWLLGDLDRLLMVLFKSRKSLNLPAGHGGRWRCLREFLQFRQKDMYYEVLRRDDPGPWFYEVRRWLNGHR